MWKFYCSFAILFVNHGACMASLLNPVAATSPPPTVSVDGVDSSEKNKQINQRAYDDTAEVYAKNVAQLHPRAEADKFLGLLFPGDIILDVGCGSGRDAGIFCEKGFGVVGIDFSPKLIALARQSAPKADFLEMDIEALDFRPGTFDGVWASNSLLHIPKKNMPQVLHRINRVLKVGGIFFVSIKEGDNEVVERDSRYGDIEKFWSYFQKDEILDLLIAAGFQVIEVAVKEKTVAYETHSQIRIWCQKRTSLL